VSRTIEPQQYPWYIIRTTVWEGLDASIDLTPSKDDPLTEALPINMILGAFIMRGDMHTDPPHGHCSKTTKPDDPKRVIPACTTGITRHLEFSPESRPRGTVF